MVAAIACVDKNWGIGKDGDLLFDIPEDKKFFKETTKDSVVIMGRKTWDSLPKKPLPNRLNIVVTRGEKGIRNNALFVDIDDVIKILQNAKEEDRYFVIGGGQIYKTLLQFCNVIFITRIYQNKEADAYFPELHENWYCFPKGEIKEFNDIKYEFLEYRRFKIIA